MPNVRCHVCFTPMDTVYELSEYTCQDCRNFLQPPHFKMFDRAKKRAKDNGIPFTIKREDIVIPEFCPVLGMPLKTGSGTGKPADSSPSLDKIIPSLGYVKGNIAVISHRANTLKRDGTADELRKIADWIDNQTVQSHQASGPEGAVIS